MIRMTRKLLVKCLATILAAGVLAPFGAYAQTATITGRVTDRATQAPIADAQVIVVGTQRGSRTDAEGNYRIANAPAGALVLRAQRIGYQAATQSVNVGASGTSAANFVLSTATTTLDEIVVTATGETQRRRESGVVTGRIDTSQVNMANVQSFSDVLKSRSPGVVVQQAGGETGGASRIRIRGSNSIQLSNDPLLIIDGVRVNNNPNSTAIGTGGQTPSRFNDVNSDDIESVEVIKGPAAAALYGTAASNGVIQITTKRGKAGKPKWGTAFEYGTVRENADFPSNFTQIGTNLTGTTRITNCNLDARGRGVCIPKADSLVSTNPIANNSPFRDGWREQIGLNLSGGSDVAQYYLGSDFEREEGVYPVNSLRKTNFRVNLNAQPRSALTLGLNTSYLSSRQQRPQNDNNTLGAISGALIGKAFDCGLPRREVSCGIDTLGRGYRTANHPSSRFFAITTKQDVEHFVGSANATWQARDWLSFLGTTGYDFIDRFDTETWPKDVIEVFVPQGYRQTARANIRSYTGNGSAVGTFQPTSTLRLVSTLGSQWTREVFTRTDAYGETLLPGTNSLGGTSTAFTVGESSSDIVTIGGLFQQRAEWRDKLFLSAAFRADKNSNFGANLPFIKYPAAQLSYVIGDESFFPQTNFIRDLRFRAAYGESGQRPDFRQADKFFSPVAVAVNGLDVSGVTIGGAGNANLRPERTREFEFGFDASLLNDRVGVEFTHYNKQTRDALIGRRLAPSVGATTTQLVNLGRVENKGSEYLVSVKGPEFSFFKSAITFSGSINDNKVVELGTGITPIIFGLGGDTQRHQSGYPLGGYWARQIVSFADKNNDGIISRVNCPTYGTSTNPQIAGGPACEIVLTDTAVYSGNPLGRTELAISPSVSMGWLKVQALVDHRGGLTLNNSTGYFRCNTSPNECPAIQDKNAPLEDQARAISTFMGTRGAFFEDASFWKLRELSVTASLPRNVKLPFGATAASITVAGRNLKTWTDYKGLDPELNTSSASNFNTADFLTQPPVKYWVTRVNINF